MYLRKISYLVAVFALCTGLAGCAERVDIMLADFEGDDFGSWEVTGECFGSRPAHGPLGDQDEVKGFEGKGFLNTYHGGDRAEGIMTSPEFVIERDYLNFLIGGGDTGETSFELLIDGKIVHSVTGRNEETLRWRSWDVTSFRAKKARDTHSRYQVGRLGASEHRQHNAQRYQARAGIDSPQDEDK